MPAKGRLREPSVALLHDAGLGPEQPGERALAFPCRNAPVDVLLVRAADVPEYVQDGVVDCGITGIDLVRERKADVEVLLELGFGACTLQAAVPAEAGATGLGDLAGLRVATVYPHLARTLLAERGIEAELIEITGSVEVAPRLGLADAIVDLVSSGNTLRTNGLRSIGTLLSSQAVLVGRREGDGRARQLAGLLRTVVDARATRYLMLNAPADQLDRICELVPGSRSPSVLPLAEENMVAVHALVPAADVWQLLPALEAAGATSILLLPVERMLGVTTTAAEIVEDVKARGEEAVREWAERLDGVSPALAEATEAPAEAVLALADAVRRWHAAQRPADIRMEITPGVELERRWVPLDSVGIYVPRGLVSTLVMCAVPALEAGVERIVVTTPPSGAGPVAAAARLLGIDEVWAIGGPQAIAWLAYVQRVAKIVGPGSAPVNEAKLLVSRDVAIDLPAGPSEVVVLAGRGADRHAAELELAAQGEHGPDSVCRLIEADADPELALAEAEAIAPEHLVLLGDAEALAGRVRNAGAVFVGPWSSVAAGDYATGGNHVLPTGGRARADGGLGLEAFLKPVTTQRITREGLAALRPTVEALAAVEGMPLHAEAVRR